MKINQSLKPILLLLYIYTLNIEAFSTEIQYRLKRYPRYDIYLVE